jgi:beta-lactamase regulating signal transducer with metallopeptidase domain
MASGPFRHAILLPHRLSDELSDDELRHVCLHEAAHLARRDDCALLLQRVIHGVCARSPRKALLLLSAAACNDQVVRTLIDL